MVHASGTEEQERLEEGVGQQMEDRRDVAAQAKRQHHVAELADRRVGKHALDVDDDERKQRRYQGCRTADGGDRHPRVVRHLVDREHTGDQVDAGDDHRRSVDQCGNRRRAFHGIRQPNMKRELRGLARCSGEHAEPKDRQDVHANQARDGEFLNLGDVKRARLHPDQDDRQQQAKIAQPGDDKRLHGRLGGGRLVEPEADQQIRRKPHQLPEYE